MAAIQRFSPHYHGGQTVTSGASAQYSITPESLAICLTNTGATNAVYVRIGTGTFTADATDFVIMPNAQVVLSKPFGSDKIAVYGAAATTLHIIDGEGF